MCRIGSVQARLTNGDEIFDPTMEHVGRCEQRQPRVLVMMVVPVEELGTPSAGMLYVTEAPGEIGLVLERLELRLGKRVVVGNARSTMTGIDPQLAQQIEKAVCSHRGAAVLVHA